MRNDHLYIVYVVGKMFLKQHVFNSFFRLLDLVQCGLVSYNVIL